MLFPSHDLQAVLQIDLVDALRRWIKSVATLPSGPMEDGVAIVAATNQPEQRFGGGKMYFKLSAIAPNLRHPQSPFPQVLPKRPVDRTNRRAKGGSSTIGLSGHKRKAEVGKAVGALLLKTRERARFRNPPLSTTTQNWHNAIAMRHSCYMGAYSGGLCLSLDRLQIIML
jgi:hypothetical protein